MFTCFALETRLSLEYLKKKLNINTFFFFKFTKKKKSIHVENRLKLWTDKKLIVIVYFIFTTYTIQ